MSLARLTEQLIITSFFRALRKRCGKNLFFRTFDKNLTIWVLFRQGNHQTNTGLTTNSQVKCNVELAARNK